MTETKRAKWPRGVPVPDTKPELNLSEGDGNVFFIIGRARRVAHRAGWTDAQVDAFATLAQAGDYDHALQTCFRYFDVR